jgi:hypothetical protein
LLLFITTIETRIHMAAQKQAPSTLSPKTTTERKLSPLILKPITKVEKRPKPLVLRPKTQSTSAQPHVQETDASPLAPEPINVGAGGPLIVPREDIYEGIEVGQELDLTSGQALKIRKPDRREWIVLDRESELPTHLLIHKEKPDSMDVEYYFVANELRAPIAEELKPCRIFRYYSIKSRTYALWVLHVNEGLDWYESIADLLHRGADFFSRHQIRVKSDRQNDRYRSFAMPLQRSVEWPQRQTAELLGEALGEHRFIRSADHPVYRELIEGEELA